MKNHRIGYACLNEDTRLNYRSLRKNSLTEEKLREIIEHNLLVLEEMLLWNEKNQVFVYRISSDLIPFGSSPINKLAWDLDYKEDFERLKTIIKRSGQRISFHPGQYTVLNSPRIEVVEASRADLAYHAKLLDLLGGDGTNKMVLHLGGVYGDKKKAMERFVENYKTLDSSIKKHLVIENDDKSYTIEDVLAIGEKENIPVIFDNLHHQINRKDKKDLKESFTYYMKRSGKTWDKKDGRPIIHYSQQKEGERPGRHSEHIEIDDFKAYLELIEGPRDIMLEVKDKNRSFLSSNQVINPDKRVLEDQWAKYKYLVLLKDHKNYLAIRELLKDERPDVLAFYRLIEKSAKKKAETKNLINGYSHVWGYFKDQASSREKETYQAYLDQMDIKKGLKFLERLEKKYPSTYLSKSYLFRPGAYWNFD